jgi:hypothetical protein
VFRSLERTTVMHLQIAIAAWCEYYFGQTSMVSPCLTSILEDRRALTMKPCQIPQSCILLTLQELRERLRLPGRDAAAAAPALRPALPPLMPPPAQPMQRQAAPGAARPAAGQAEQITHLTVDAAARLPEGAPAAVAGMLTSDPRRVAVQHSTGL